MRNGFSNVNLYAGSTIDANLSIQNFYDVVKNFPRAVQVAFLSPFPSHWIEKGKETGFIGRIISGIETAAWYVIIIGFVFLVLKNRLILEPLVPLLMLSIIIIILLGYIVPNVGTIYRMRQGFMIPFFIFGMYGVQMIRHSLLTKFGVR